MPSGARVKMLQIIALVLISWLLVWLLTKSNLSVLGLTPTLKRLKYGGILLVVSGLLAASAFWLRTFIAQEEYVLAPGLTLNAVLVETWHQIRTVLTEELICRGVLLYYLIRTIGQTKAIVITSVIFAILHWINAGIWGNLIQMAMVFTFTFAMGLLLAYAYARTFSLLIPFAIHFGWNLTQNYIFPDSAAGNHIFVLAAPPPEVTISYLAFFIMLLFPKISVLIVDYVIIRKHRQALLP